MEDLLKEVNKIIAIQRGHEEERRRFGDFFNVFKTLGVVADEVKHSAFLAELLNPRGSCGVGDAFLKAFVSRLGWKECTVNSFSDAVVTVEKNIGEKNDTEGGRLDVEVKFGEYVLIIENKIYAKDQDAQLVRYSNYALKKYPKGRVKLLYLTLDGHYASENSSTNVEYETISYRDFIDQWLGECVRIAYDKPLVRETIRQYICIVQQLTNQTMEKGDEQKIKELAVNNIEAVASIIAIQQDIFDSFVEQKIIDELLKYYKDKNVIVARKEGLPRGIDFKPNDWGSLIVRVVSESTNGGWSKMYVGVTSGQEYSRSFPPKLACLQGNPTSWWPFGWEYFPQEFLNWQSVNGVKNAAGTVKWIEDKVNEIVDEMNAKRYGNDVTKRASIR